MKIMFVCLGNICRSPVGHAVFDHLAAERGAVYETESSGTGAYHVGEQADSRMRKTARSHGITIDHRARHLSRQDLLDYDLILAMDQNNYRDIISLTGGDQELTQKVRLFRDFDPEAEDGASVPDPYYGGSDGFENVFQIVFRTAENLLDILDEGRL